jgi:hypothetical protein
MKFSVRIGHCSYGGILAKYRSALQRLLCGGVYYSSRNPKVILRKNNNREKQYG